MAELKQAWRCSFSLAYLSENDYHARFIRKISELLICQSRNNKLQNIFFPIPPYPITLDWDDANNLRDFSSKKRQNYMTF